MSDYTTRDILRLIEAQGGPEGLDLRSLDLREVNLSSEVVREELNTLSRESHRTMPVWVSRDTDGINLRGANLQGARLEGADLRQADLQDAILWGADLRKAKLEAADLRGANLGWAKLWQTGLQDSQLQGANLEEVRFHGVFLWGANLQGAYLSGADLTGTNLLDLKSLEGARLYGAILDHTQLTKDQLLNRVGEELRSEWTHAREAYLALKNNFRQLGRYGDAAWAYGRERRMEKMEARERAIEAQRDRRWADALRHWAKVAGDQLAEWVCDYGDNFWQVLRAIGIVWLCFALVYGLVAGVWGPWHETDTGQVRTITRNPVDLLSFSLGAMTTLTPADLEARPVLAMRLLVPLEALLGIGLAGLAGFVAGNRIRRS